MKFSFEIGKQCLEVLDRLWNESGHEEDISGEEFEQSGENDEDYFDESESSDEFLFSIETVQRSPQVWQWCVPFFRFIIEGAQREDLSTDCQNDITFQM